MCFPVDPLIESRACMRLARGDEARRQRGVTFRHNGGVLALFLAVSMLASPTARAQDNANGGGATSDVTQLLLDLDDIDSMRPLVPLKLTPEQMDKMIAVISSEQANYDKKLKAITGPALAKLADQIRDVKQRTQKGEAIPKDFDAVAKQAENEILSKRKSLDAETLAAVANSMQETLTPDQVKLAAKLDKDAQTRLGKVTASTQRTETQWFVSYVKDVVITVPRIVIVLKGMRAAANAKTASAGTGSGAGK